MDEWTFDQTFEIAGGFKFGRISEAEALARLAGLGHAYTPRQLGVLVRWCSGYHRIGEAEI